MPCTTGSFAPGLPQRIDIQLYTIGTLNSETGKYGRGRLVIMRLFNE